MNKQSKHIIIATLLISVMIIGGIASIAGGHNSQNQGISPDNLVQGQVNSNGILWIVEYSTPTGEHYPQAFQYFHVNNLTLQIYSPLSTQTTSNITVLSYIPITGKNGTQEITDPEYLNQSITTTPRTVITYDLKIPQTPGKREVSITWGNNTVSYFISTYHPVSLPFSNDPLGIVALIGITMLIFTALNLAITKIIIDKTKYFPPLSQRIWGAIIVITLIITYQYIERDYYTLTGSNWALLFIPLFVFDLLEILSVYPGKAEENLLIHIKDTAGHDVETGLYSIKTAIMNEKEKEKYPNLNLWGKEYINERSYSDWFKRLLGIQIPIIMEVPEMPDVMDGVKGKSPGYSEEIVETPREEIARETETQPGNPARSKRGKRPEKTRKGHIWKMKDRVNREHPFTEAVLINPEKPSPAIVILEIKYTDAKGKERTKKIRILKSYLDGKHLKEAEYFLANFITASESGFEIHRLSRENAHLKAQAGAEAYRYQKELFNEIYKGIEEQKEYYFEDETEEKPTEKPKPEENKEKDKDEEGKQ